MEEDAVYGSVFSATPYVKAAKSATSSMPLALVQPLDDK